MDRESRRKHEQVQCRVKTTYRKLSAVALTFVKVSYDGSPALGGLIIMPVASCPIVLEHRDRDDSLYSSARTCIAITGGKRESGKSTRYVNKLIVHGIYQHILGNNPQRSTGFINPQTLLPKRVLCRHSSDEIEDQCGLRSNVGPGVSYTKLISPAQSGRK